jgi:hypothetical protein
MRAYFNVANDFMMTVPSPGFPVCCVAPEGTRNRELSKLVTHHILADQYWDMLSPVVHSDRQTHHVRQDRRAARPGLYWSSAVGSDRLLHLFGKMDIDERAFLD